MTALIPIARAQLDLAFARRGDRTVLERRLFSWPFVITRTFYLDQSPAEMASVIVQTSSGAIHGDDRLVQRLTLAPDTAVHLTSQGATAVHRAHPGEMTHEHLMLRVGHGAYLEYLPEPRILFPGSDLNQSIEIDCAPNGTAIVCDAFGVHDPTGSGGLFRRLQSSVTLRIDSNEPVLIERADTTRLARSSKAFASLLLIGRQNADRLEPLAAQITQRLGSIEGLYGAASLLPGEAGIGVRLAGQTVQNLRWGIDLVWTAFRYHRYGVGPASRRK